MSTQNKKIEFTTSADTKGIDQLSDRFRKLGTLVDDVVSRLKKVKLGSGSRSEDLSNVVKTTTAEMGKLRVESLKTADTLSDRVGRAVIANTQQIRQQTKEFQHAARAARDLGGATQSAARVGAIASASAGFGIGSSVGAARGAGMAVSSNMGAYGMNTGGGRGRGGPPPGSTGRWAPYANNPMNQWSPEFGTMDDGIRAAKGTLGFASGVAEMGGRFGKFESDTAMQGLNNLARSQSYRQDLFRMSTSAPVGYGSYLLGRGTSYASGSNNSAQDAIVDGMSGEAGRVGRDRTGTNASIIGDRASEILKGRALSTGADMVTSPLSAVGSGLDTVTSAAKGNFGQAGRNLKQTANSGFDALTMSRNIGAGALNAESSEAMSGVLNTLQRIAGPQAQMAFGSIQSYAPLLASSSRMTGGNGRQAMAMGAGAGYDVGSSTGVLSGLGQHFGARAVMEGGLGKRAFDMSKKGMDAGVAGGIMGQIDMAGGDGQQVLERIFAKGMKQGMDQLDMKFFEKIGTAVAENSITGSGSVSGGNMAEALMMGLNKKSTMADVQGNISGMNLANQMSTQNGFFSSRSMALASEALGDKASGVTIQALNETTPTDLMADKNEYLDNLGIDKKTRQKFGKDRLNMLGNVLGGGAAGDGPEAKRIQAGISKYGDFSTYMQKGGQKERDFAGAVGKSVFGGADYDTFQGMMNFIGGSNRKAGSGKGGSELKDVVDGQAITNIATQTKLIFKQFENVNKILGDIVKGSNGAVKNIGEAYSMLAKGTVDMVGQTMSVGGESYSSSADAAAATAGVVGGMSQLKDVTEDTAAALAKLYGVALAAAANKAPARTQPKPITTKPLTRPPGSDGGKY